MKKALSLLLVLFMLVATLASCNVPTGDPTDAPSGDATGKPTEAPFTGITKEEWQAAIADEKFDNVTIHMEFDYDETDTENTISGPVDGAQSIKIADDTVLRTMKMDEYEMSMFFTDEDAVVQRKMFVDVFLSLLAERDNYVYDPESKTYKAPEKVSVTVNPAEGSSDLVEMTNGVVTFDNEGRLIKFACTLKETVTVTFEGQSQTHSTPKAETVWTFADYGKTVITDEEKEAGSPSDGVEDEEQVGNEIPAPEENVAE